MASVIRLLPRKKIERNVVPYVDLLDNVMRKRFSQAIRTNSYLVFIALIITTVIARPSVSFRRTLNLFLSGLVYMIMLKLVFRSQKSTFPSVVLEARYRLRSLATYLPLLLHSVSGWLYLKSILVPESPLYFTNHAEPIKTPEGIPASLALHKTDKWFVLNEKYTYLLCFILALSMVFGLPFIFNHLGVLRLDPAENGMKPFLRIKRRLVTGFKPAFVKWAGTSLIFPLVYLLVARSWVASIGGMYVTSGSSSNVMDLSGFKIAYMLLPVFVMPLCLIWYISFEIFMAYMSLGPVFKGKLISDAAVSDKNSTLVDGLSRSSNSLSSLTSWHELLLIAEHDASRRRSIFNDVDGERVIWEQVHHAFEKLMNEHIKALSPAKKSNKEKANEPSNQKDNRNTHNGANTGTVDGINQAPKHAASSIAELLQPGNNLNTFSSAGEPLIQVRASDPSKLYKPESAFEKKLANLTKTLQSRSTTRTQKARAYLLSLTKKAQLRLQAILEAFLATRAGFVFRKTVESSIAMKIQHPQTTAFALRSVARMITKSIDEDEYGYVQGTISSTLSLLDTYADLLEKLATNPPIDSSDILVKRGEVKPNVSLALSMAGEVNGAFAEIVEVFQPYLENLRATTAVQGRAKRYAAGGLIVAKTAWME